MSVRLEVRLDEKRRAQLEEIAGSRGESISDVVRALIDDAYEEVRGSASGVPSSGSST